jgi:dihydroxy-acid dehydratase
LHAAPEAAAGGPLAWVKDGDPITLDVPKRTLVLDVPEAELARRRATWKPAPADTTRGYRRLYLDRVQQAPQGCDFDFLVPPPTAGRIPV